MSEATNGRLIGPTLLLSVALNEHDIKALNDYTTWWCAQLTRAEKVIEDIKKALDLDGSAHARHNLDGAYIDLERQGADKICLKTLRRVRNQLGEIEQTLAEYDRPSAPERDGRDTDG